MKKRDRSIWVDEELVGAEEARKIVSDALAMYQETYPNGAF